MTSPQKFAALAFFLLLASCKFEPDGDFFNPITPPDVNSTVIALTDADKLVGLSYPTTFSFKVLPEGRGTYTAIVSYDGVEVKNATWSEGLVQFTLDPNGHPSEGKLTIRVAYPSRSPSLGGQLGTEIIVFEQTWPVKLDLTLPSPIDAPSVGIEDGKLIIRWLAPSKFNFSSLRVVRTYANGRIDVINVSDVHNTSVEDKTYAGGQVSYTVDMSGSGYVKGKTTNFNCTPIQLNVDANTGIVSWERPLLYNNAQLRLNVGINSYPISIAGTYDPFVRFGTYVNVKATITATGMTDEGKPTEPYESANYKVGIGSEIQPFEHAVHLKNPNLILFKTASSIYTMDAETYAIRNSRSIPSSVINRFYLSGDQQYGYLFDNSNFYRFDPISLNIIETISFSSLVGFNQGISNLSVSNGNIVAAIFFGSPKRYIIDMNTKTILLEITSTDDTLLSPDGNFMIKGTTIYARGNNTWSTLLGKLPYYSPFFLSNMRQEPGLDHAYMLSPSGKVNVFDLNSTPNTNGEFVSIYEFQEQGSFLLDAPSKIITVISGPSYSQTLQVYDLDTKLKVHTFTNISGLAYYLNGDLFHPNGFLWAQ